MAAEVVVVGNVGIDTTVLPGRSPGSETVFTGVLDCVGHAGGYSARGYTALGRRTAVVGHVGDDPLGRWAREELAGDGIDVTALGIDPAGTARSVNLLGTDGSRRNHYDGRGHLTLYPPAELDLPVVDTDGAGDALAVGFLTAYVLEGRPVEEAIRDGLIAARWTCAQRARSDTLITAEQLSSAASPR